MGMKISVLCVGKLKEKYWRDACAEYIKRLGRFAQVEVIELADEKSPDGASPAEEEAVKSREGERILSRLDRRSFVVALALDGRGLGSEELADFIGKKAVSGESRLSFVIGGSLGLSDAVLKTADFRLCFSKMTFPHQLMRVILLEQLYRAFKIINNEPYHK